MYSLDDFRKCDHLSGCRLYYTYIDIHIELMNYFGSHNRYTVLYDITLKDM